MGGGGGSCWSTAPPGVHTAAKPPSTPTLSLFCTGQWLAQEDSDALCPALALFFALSLTSVLNNDELESESVSELCDVGGVVSPPSVLLSSGPYPRNDTFSSRAPDSMLCPPPSEDGTSESMGCSPNASQTGSVQRFLLLGWRMRPSSAKWSAPSLPGTCIWEGVHSNLHCVANWRTMSMSSVTVPRPPLV